MSRTSLGQRNQVKATTKSSVSSGLNLVNQISSKRLSTQFPIQTYINLQEELNSLHIYDKYIKFAQSGKGQKETYKGDLKNGKKQGFGCYTFRNLDQYTGFWTNDNMHGKGLYQYDSGNSSQKFVYVGEFSDGKFTGIGKLILLDNKSDRQGNVTYQGYWQKGQKSGYGIYFYGIDNSIYYQGYWQNDKKNGQGRLVFKNGQYSGLWKNDNKHGQGKLRIQRPQRILIYEGQWIKDQLTQGEITYLASGADSTKQASYKGQIKNGKKHGQGILQANGIKMKGTFDNDHFIGKGTLFNDQYTIEGDFHNTKAPLTGKIQYLNGDIYHGELDISTGLIKRKQGEYKFKHGDSAKGKFDDQGNGILSGFFQYLWGNGANKKYNI